MNARSELEPLAAMHALYWFLARLAADRPVVLAVDDAHWADDASLRWIAYATGRLEGLGVGVLIATRPVDPGGGSPLAEVEAEGLAHVLRLGPLRQESVGTLVRREFGTASNSTSRRAAREVHAATSEVFPIPAPPSTTSRPDEPPSVRCSSASICARSASRSSSRSTLALAEHTAVRK
jgi:hypothetical protein